jgi:methanogenic corrinoid protein MtbC1
MHAIIKLQDHITKKPSNGKIAICGCLEGEYHEIGITCVNNILESNGWTTFYLGTNLPTESFIDAIDQYVPTLVCVSSTVPKSKRQLVEACAAIHDTTQIIRAKLVVGGLAAGDDTKKRLKADHLPSSIEELMGFVSTLA